MLLELQTKMDARQAAELTRAVLMEAFASPGFQSRVIGARLDGAQRERLANKVMEAMAVIKRGPHKDDSIRVDAGEMGYLSRELLYKLRGQKEVKYGELKGRSLVPISNEVPAGAETYSYDVFDRTGKAQVGSTYEGRAKRVDVKISEVVGKIDIIRGAFGWNVQDLRAAAMAGRSLPTLRGMVARMAMELGIDDNLATGVANTAIKGLVNNASVPIYSSDTTGGATDLTGFTGSWGALAEADARDMITECNLLINAVRAATLELEMQEKRVDIVLPTTAYGAFASMPFSDQVPDSIMSVVLRTNPWIRSVASWSKLNAAGVGGRDRAIFYTKDATNLEGQIPLEITQHPPEAEALEFLVEMEARVAGVSVYFPKSMAYLDGV